ncbi:MAG: hypothetical protein J6Y08_09275 [Clostridiales bacterium]|nr:hypothetical protein [Clostridiales bacterium]
MKYRVPRSLTFGMGNIEIKDEWGKDRYNLLYLHKVGYSFEFCDVAGKKFADIKQVISFSNKFKVKTETKEVTVHFKYPLKINALPYCKFTNLDWSTQGDIHHREYFVLDGSKEVAHISLAGPANDDPHLTRRALSDMQRDLEIKVSDEYDEPLTLAVIIAIELAQKADATRS